MSRRVERSKDEVQKILQTFLDGTDGKWDWDDFVSIPIKDRFLDSVRERLRETDTGGEYPPRTERGRETIRTLLDELSVHNA